MNGLFGRDRANCLPKESGAIGWSRPGVAGEKRGQGLNGLSKELRLEQQELLLLGGHPPMCGML